MTAGNPRHIRLLAGNRRALMRVCLAAGIVLTASGCAAWDRLNHRTQQPPPIAAEKPPTVIAPPPSAPAPKPKRTVREPASAPREAVREPERVAAIDPNALIGLAPAAVEKLLGTPSGVSKGDPSLVWTYAGQGCSFQIFFYPDLKTASFHALKYGRAGGGNDSSDACIRNILTVKSNGPG